MKPKILTLVKDTTAEFTCYRDGDLWYQINYIDPESKFNLPKKFDFQVPIKDTGTGIFPNKIKAITLMRWIRKALENV